MMATMVMVSGCIPVKPFSARPASVTVKPRPLRPCSISRRSDPILRDIALPPHDRRLASRDPYLLSIDARPNSFASSPKIGPSSIETLARISVIIVSIISIVTIGSVRGEAPSDHRWPNILDVQYTYIYIYIQSSLINLFRSGQKRRNLAEIKSNGSPRR